MKGAGGWDALGVSDVDRGVYLQALRQPGAGPAGWAEALGLPSEVIQQAVHRLRGQGLLRTTSRAGSGLEAVEPQVAARAAIRQRLADVDRFAATVGALAEELTPEYERGGCGRGPARSWRSWRERKPLRRGWVSSSRGPSARPAESTYRRTSRAAAR